MPHERFKREPKSYLAKLANQNFHIIKVSEFKIKSISSTTDFFLKKIGRGTDFYQNK